MLDTFVEYCPPSEMPPSVTNLKLQLSTSYNGLQCPDTMECKIQYKLEWRSPSDILADGCSESPTASPTQSPVLPSPSPASVVDASDERNSTPSPTDVGGSAGVKTNGTESVNGDDGSQEVTPNYLSESILCPEAWASCTTLETHTSYDNASVAGEGGGDGGEQDCTKLETVVGQVGAVCVISHV